MLTGLAIKRAMLAAATLAFVSTTVAEEQHHQHAHTHGQAQLQVAIDGSSAELILRSPAANLLGFEHEPRNAQQEAILKETRDWLFGTPLVSGANSDCTVKASTLHRRHGRGDGNSHSDLEVTQQLTCEGALTGVLVTPLPGRFPEIERMSVAWVSNKGQGHAELQQGENRISLGH